MHTNTADSVHRDWFFRLLLCTTRRLSDYVHRDSVFCPLVRVSVYVANEPVQCFSVSQSVRRTERCRLCSQGQRLCALAYVILCDLQQPVQMLQTTGARRHQFVYAEPYRFRAMHGQIDKNIYSHSVDIKT